MRRQDTSKAAGDFKIVQIFTFISSMETPRRRDTFMAARDFAPNDTDRLTLAVLAKLSSSWKYQLSPIELRLIL